MYNLVQSANTLCRSPCMIEQGSYINVLMKMFQQQTTPINNNKCVRWDEWDYINLTEASLKFCTHYNVGDPTYGIFQLYRSEHIQVYIHHSYMFSVK